MTELNNPFKEGQEVICISESFPLIQQYGGIGKEAASTPEKGEFLVIDEILGEFLRFDKYDTEESNNWWKCDRFAPVTQKAIEEADRKAEALADELFGYIRKYAMKKEKL